MKKELEQILLKETGFKLNNKALKVYFSSGISNEMNNWSKMLKKAKIPKIDIFPYTLYILNRIWNGDIPSLYPPNFLSMEEATEFPMYSLSKFRNNHNNIIMKKYKRIRSNTLRNYQKAIEIIDKNRR